MADTSFLSSLKNSASNAFNSLTSLGLGQLSASISARRNYKYAQRAAEEDLRRSKDFYDYTFDKTNAYNDPSAVRSRLLSSGINPYATGLDPGAGGSTSFGPGSISGDSTPGSLSAPSASPLEFAQARKANAEADAIEATTPNKDEFLKRYTAENLGLELSNISQDYSNQVSSWDAKYAELMKGLEVSKSSATLDNLHRENTNILYETKLLMNENRRDRLVTNKLRREIDLLIGQRFLADAEYFAKGAEGLKLLADFRSSLVEGDTLLETLKRMRMENSYLDKEKGILYENLENELWRLTRGSTQTGWGKFNYRLSEFSSAVGGLFSGNISYSASRGTRTSTVMKLIKK